MFPLFLACAGPELPLDLRFEAAVDGVPVEITDDQPYTNAAGEPYGVRRYRAFLSALTLVDEDGATLSLQDAWYVDLEEAETLSLALSVPDEGRTWVGLDVVLGLDPDLDLQFDAPPESEMFWPDSLGGGYHHLKLEGRTTTPEGDPSTFALHAGPLDGVDYSVPVSLALGPLALGAEGATLALVADPSRWMSDPHTIVLSELPNGGVMDVPEVQGWLQDNGHDVLSLEVR